MSPLLHAAVLFCFLLPFVTVGTSCSEYETKPVTGVQLLTGADPGIESVTISVDGTVTRTEVSTSLPSEDLGEINALIDVARTGAWIAFVAGAAAFLLTVAQTRRRVVASIWLGLVALVAYALIARAAETGKLLIGLDLAWLFTLVVLVWDAFVLRRLGGWTSFMQVVLLVIAIPITLVAGFVIGGALGP